MQARVRVQTPPRRLRRLELPRPRRRRHRTTTATQGTPPRRPQMQARAQAQMQARVRVQTRLRRLRRRPGASCSPPLPIVRAGTAGGHLGAAAAGNHPLNHGRGPLPFRATLMAITRIPSSSARQGTFIRVSASLMLPSGGTLRRHRRHLHHLCRRSHQRHLRRHLRRQSRV